MSRPWALAITIVFIFLVPGTFAAYIPWAITDGAQRPPFLGLEATRWVGLALIAVGAAVVLEAMGRFVWQGFGTPAPIAPPQKLVVSGFYRYVRNPMYVAVTALVIGQALWFANGWLFAYAAFLLGFFHLFVLVYEEPTLKRKFPEEYPAFRAAVPRWIPRLTPWRPG